MKNLKFDGTQLKYIAIIAMTIDHLAWLLYPGLVKEPIPVLMHIVGRLISQLCGILSQKDVIIQKILKNISLE